METRLQKLRFELEGVALVVVFGGLYLFERTRKFVKGDKSPTMVFPFFGGGQPRRY